MSGTETTATFKARVLSTTRVFPQKPPSGVSHVSLSIIDATVTNFAPSGAVWFFPPASPSSATSPESLKYALEVTLNAYPHLSGRLHWAPYRAHGSHTERWGRLMVSHGEGRARDPGVEFVVGVSDVTLASIVPSPQERTKNDGVWDASQAPLEELLPSTTLAPAFSPTSAEKDEETWADAPCLAVQVTTFKCGGRAIALQAAHPIADAMALSFVVKDWAANAKALKDIDSQNSSEGIAAIVPPPCFNPALLDRCGAGDIETPQPDLELVKIARALPSHRYDWWDSSASQCPWDSTAATVPTALQAKPMLLTDDAGEPMPWKDWDVALPVAHYIIHFSQAEVRTMWEAVPTDLQASKHDALIAHVWACINRARGLADDEENVHLDITLGLRARLSPPVPDKFMGSPIILADVSASGREASLGEPTAVVKKIKSTIALFTSEKISAHLHDKLHVASPQRIWQTFQGKRHIILTSWVHTGVHEVDFGDGPPLYVEAVMPPCDGCVQVMEAAPRVKNDENGAKSSWWAGGVDMSVHLEQTAMERLLKEPLLRRYIVS